MDGGDLVLVVGPVEDGGPPVALEHLDPPRQADGPQRLRAPCRLEPVAEDLGSSGDGKPGADHLVLLPVGRHLGDLDARLVQPDHEGVVVAPHVQGVADQPQRTLQLATPVLDDLPDARLGGSAHHPAAGPEDADLVGGDLLHGGAEDVDVVETHVRQDLDPAAEDVGGVVGTTETDLDDGDVHVHRTEEREGEGHLELEVRRGAVRRRVRLDQLAERQRLVQDLRRKGMAAIELPGLVEGLHVGRQVQPHLELVCAQDGGRQRGDGSLAGGSADVDVGVGVLRGAGRLQHPLDALEPQVGLSGPDLHAGHLVEQLAQLCHGGHLGSDDLFVHVSCPQLSDGRGPGPWRGRLSWERSPRYLAFTQ